MSAIFFNSKICSCMYYSTSIQNSHCLSLVLSDITHLYCLFFSHCNLCTSAYSFFSKSCKTPFILCLITLWLSMQSILRENKGIFPKTDNSCNYICRCWKILDLNFLYGFQSWLNFTATNALSKWILCFNQMWNCLIRRKQR